MIKKILSIIGISSGCIVIALIFSMMNTAIPKIQDDLGLSMNVVQWMMTVFGLINCATLVSWGRLADMYGRKKIFFIGLGASLLGMIVGGSSETGGFLILAMGFAGLGNAILLPVSQAMLVAEFPKKLKGRAIAIWVFSLASAMAVGPLLGGIISHELGWRFVFWGNIPVIIVALACVALFSKESKNREDPPVLDVWGMLYLALTIGSFVLLITEWKALPLLALPFLSLLGGVACCRLVQHEKRFICPLLLKELFFDRAFIGGSLAGAILIFFIWSNFFLLPLYLHHVRHFIPFTQGVILLGISVPALILTPFMGYFYKARRAGIFVIVGFLLLIASALTQSLFEEESSFSLLMLATSLFGVGYSFICTPSATVAVSAVSRQRAGIASGSLVTIQEIGGTLGLAIVVSYVRHFDELLVGYQQGMLLLAFFGLLGLVASFLLLTCPKPVIEKG